MKTISTFHTGSDALLEQAFNQFRSQFQQIISIEKQNHKPQIETPNLMELKLKIDKYKHTITSLSKELHSLKQKHTPSFPISNNNYLTKDIKSIKEDTTNMKHLISTMQSDINDIKQLLLNKLDKPITNALPIKTIQNKVHINNLHSSDIYCPIALTDKRIATCSYDNSISVLSVDYSTYKWNQDIHKVNAHNSHIWSICELTNNRLVSCSDDYVIKIWEITKNDLNLLSSFTAHSNWIARVIPITNNRFVSCSNDKTAKVWSSESPYKELATLLHNGSVQDVIKLNNKEILVSSNYGSKALDFWDLKTYTKLNTVKGVYTEYLYQGMIELSNGLIAVSSHAVGNPIVIVNPVNFTVVKEIQAQKVITHCSSLCVFDEYSFVYVYDGTVVQVSVYEDYKIIGSVIGDKQLNGAYGFVSVDNRKCLVVTNTNKGLSVVKPCF